MEQTVRSRALGFQRFSETRLGSPRDCQEMRFVIVGRQALVEQTFETPSRAARFFQLLENLS